MQRAYVSSNWSLKRTICHRHRTRTIFRQCAYVDAMLNCHLYWTTYYRILYHIRTVFHHWLNITSTYTQRQRRKTIRMWYMRKVIQSDWRLNITSTYAHAYGFSLLCVRRCDVKLPSWMNEFSRTSHAYGFSPLCVSRYDV